MKKIFLPALVFITLSGNSQPRLVGTLQYSGQKESGSIYRVNMPGTTPGAIHFFDRLAHRPGGGVCAGDADWLYGMLTYNGVNNNGALYKIKQDGTNFTLLYNIDNSGGISVVPYYHSDNQIYFSNQFQLKKLDPATNTITNIDLSAGLSSRNLLIDANNWIYFLTGGGSTSIAKIKTDGTAWTTMHAFNNATDGSGGTAGITEVPGDSLFGLQFIGGASDGGTIFSIKKDGTGFMVHHHFTAATGINPTSKLVYFDGRLFGTTTQGGSFNNGVIYTINPDGTGYRVLHHFETGNSSGSAVPYSNISISSNGRIFGSFAGWYSTGFANYRLFKADTSGQNFEVFFNLDQREQGNGTNDVLLLNDASIFITTVEMGRHDGGVLSQCDTSGYFTSLYHFGYSANGFRPDKLIKTSDGKLYGTTVIGGTSGNGVIFSMNADGTGYTKLHELTDAEGYQPSGKLLEASDGNLYGACRYDGTNGLGSIYRIDKNGNNFTIIYSFPNGVDGYSPVGSLVEDNSGKLYGANFYGGSGGGTLFQVDKNGNNYTVLKDLNTGSGLSFPYNGLTLSSGFLYGTCGYGGVANAGGIFRIKTDGTAYQVLHEFAGATDGELPVSTPVIASNGKLYGVAAYGGNNGHGTIYRMDTTGSNFIVLKHFLESVDGSYPWGGLIQASDGLIYGTTTFGINSGTGGNIVKMNLDGSNFSIVKSFDMFTEGQGVNSIIDLNGNFTLPVQLFTFTAQKNDQTVLLNWKTAQELNSSRFNIERSADGNIFKTIGALVAAGNANTITSYSFTDVSPLKGFNFYRLKQIDIDGSFTYSKVITVNFNNVAKLVLSPNPASNHLIVQLPQGNYSSLNIFDATGRLILQENISTSSNIIRVNIQHLPKGSYVLRLIGKESEQKRFIKN